MRLAELTNGLWRFGACLTILFSGIPCGLWGQPPAITQEGVRNLASQMPPSLSGGAIAPGALFTIRGLRLGGGNSQTQVHLRKGDSDLRVELLTSSAEYLEARMPVGATAGDSHLVVVRDGAASRVFPLRIAPAAFGIFARNGKGWGPGEIVNYRGVANAHSSPAHPGEQATLAGTGLGGNRSVAVWVGGKRASRIVSIVPRAGTPGIDEIRFELSKDTPLGCYVPVMVQLPGMVSNAVSMSVAAQNQPCPNTVSLTVSPSPGPTALVVLARVMTHLKLTGGNPADFTQDFGAAIFSGEADAETFLAPWRQLPPVGTCTTYSGQWLSDPNLNGVADFLSQVAGPAQDAGLTISVDGPKGSALLLPKEGRHGFYAAEVGGGLPFRRLTPPLFLEKGTFRISGAGGRDVGEFHLEAPYESTLKWSNASELDTIDRARGATVEWRGSNVRERMIVVAMNVDTLTGGMGACMCVAPGQAGRLQIPPMMLANLPASRDLPGIPLNYVLMGALPAGLPQSFTARGVRAGVALFTAIRVRTALFR